MWSNLRLVRAVLAVCFLLGVALWVYGLLFGLCGSIYPGPAECPTYYPYEALGSPLAVISIAGLALTYYIRRPRQQVTPLLAILPASTRYFVATLKYARGRRFSCNE